MEDVLDPSLKSATVVPYHDDSPKGIVHKNDRAERQEGRAHDFILSAGLLTLWKVDDAVSLKGLMSSSRWYVLLAAIVLLHVLCYSSFQSC